MSKEICKLAEAEFLDINGKIFVNGQTFWKTTSGVEIRTGLDYFQTIDEVNFGIFNIIPKRNKPLPKAEFEAEIEPFVVVESENHGMTTELVRSVCVKLPEEFRSQLGKKAKISIQVL